MSQGALSTPNGSGSSVRAGVNAAVARLATKASGTAAPTDIATYEDWVDTDTPGGGTSSHFLYDGSQSIKLGEIDTAAHAYRHDDRTLRLPKGFISGYTYQNNASDAANDLDIAAGYAVDATGVRLIVGAALTKRSDAAWAVGGGNGMLDTGAIGNGDYFLWAIMRSGTGVVDYLCSLSATAPTMPANYDYKRPIGWFRRSGGSIVAFKTYELAGGGLRYTWKSKPADISLSSTLTTTRRLDVVSVPVGLVVEARMLIAVNHGTANGQVYVSCPDDTDEFPNGHATNGVATIQATGQVDVFTDASARIASKGNASPITGYVANCIGFAWSRR